MCNAFEIESILVDACGGSEGENEMVRFQTGPNPLNTSNITVTWANTGNTWRGICQNATTSSIISAINSTITLPGQLIEPPSGVIPANAEVMFFTSTAFNYASFNFTTLNYPMYAIFQCDGNTAGHFVNHASAYTPRTLTITFTGFGSDAVSYDAHLVAAADGGSVDFTPAGVPTYGTTGGCVAPMFPLPIELVSFTGKYENKSINLFWQTKTEKNNDYFELFKYKIGRAHV